MNKYKNLKVTVSSIHNCQKDVKDIFFNILDDYTKRFNVKVTEKPVTISICLVEYGEDAMSQGLTMYNEDEGIMLIQMRDPFLNDWEDNTYMFSKFTDIVCHEFVHACQNLTGRKGFKVKGLKYNPKDDKEKYFFDPEEMEARMLEAPYSTLYAQDLLSS
ncbi:hypothetical protein [Flavobacterium sp.]|jgi:hypothetical protein|uniref:hypothetical protein n=1 Tax=Flavobacterium sp. TaxID=239 RepID=UPI0037BF5D28